MSNAKTPVEFSLLLDGRLSPREEQAWRERLTTDPALAESYRVFKSGVELAAAGRGLADLPPGFDARLRMRLKTEELHTKARRRAKGEASRRGDWWQRAAIAVSGMAAGVAFMLAIDPTGLWMSETRVPIASNGAFNESSVVVGVLPDTAMLSPREVRHLAARKAELVTEFERSIRMAGRSIEPQMIERDVQYFLRDPSRGLLNNARIHSREVGEGTIEFLESLDSTCAQISTIVAEARNSQQSVDSERLLRLLSTLKAEGEVALYSGDSANATTEAVTEDVLARRVQSQFENLQYSQSAHNAIQFISKFPESLRLGAMTRMAVLSLHRLGDAATALRLLDEVSLASPTVLRGYTMHEIDALRNAALAPRSSMYQLKPTFNGGFTLELSPYGIEAVRERNVIANLASRLKSVLADLGPSEDPMRNLVQRMRAIEEADQSAKPMRGIPGTKALAPAKNVDGK